MVNFVNMIEKTTLSTKATVAAVFRALKGQGIRVFVQMVVQISFGHKGLTTALDFAVEFAYILVAFQVKGQHKVLGETLAAPWPIAGKLLIVDELVGQQCIPICETLTALHSTALVFAAIRVNSSVCSQ